MMAVNILQLIIVGVSGEHVDQVVSEKTKKGEIYFRTS